MINHLFGSFRHNLSHRECPDDDPLNLEFVIEQIDPKGFALTIPAWGHELDRVSVDPRVLPPTHSPVHSGYHHVRWAGLPCLLDGDPISAFDPDLIELLVRDDEKQVWSRFVPRGKAVWYPSGTVCFVHKRLAVAHSGSDLDERHVTGVHDSQRSARSRHCFNDASLHQGKDMPVGSRLGSVSEHTREVSAGGPDFVPLPIRADRIQGCLLRRGDFNISRLSHPSAGILASFFHLFSSRSSGLLQCGAPMLCARSPDRFRGWRRSDFRKTRSFRFLLGNWKRNTTCCNQKRKSTSILS